MNNRTRHRGSALLMVVGLLAILLMLGTSFLLVSRLSRKESTALAIAAPLNPMAEGLMAEALTAILADLHIATNGQFPYSSVSASNAEDLIDSPWVGASNENWLSPNDPTEKLAGTTNQDPDDYRFTRLGSFTPIENEEDNATTQYVHVDTDGDGVDDAYLFETGQVDITGRKYYGAIRIVDLSAYINVNVASESVSTSQDLGHIADGDTEPTYPDFYCPTVMNLQGFIPANYAALNDARAPQTTTSPYNILNNISLSLLDPGVNYTPFAITDELSLRWLGQKTNQRSLTGPLWEAIGDVDTGGQDSKTAQLTTYSVSRSLTRPMGNLALPTLRLLLNDSLVPAGDATGVYNDSELSSLKNYLATETGLQTFYELLNTLTGDTTLAGHVTANMWAFTQGADYQKAYAFATGGTTYYGAQPDLVISEAYAAHVAPLTTGTGDEAETEPGYVGYAIELLNPTGQSITLSNYSVGKKGEADSTPIPGGATIAAGGRQVIYFFDVQPDENGDELPDTEQLDLKKRIFNKEADFPDDWIEMSVIDFRIGGLTLYRNVENETIQVDEVTRENLEYTSLSSGFPAAGTSATEVSKNARRDDDENRARYNVAEYKKTSSGGSFTHTLDLSNDLAATDLSDVYEGFAVPTKDDRDLYSLADLMESIYTIGPASTDGSGGTNVFTKQLAEIASQPLRGKADFATDTTYGLGDGVPWPAMLGDFIEVVPPDLYRRDEIVGGTNEEMKEYPSRVYGRVNINTASKEVLEQLPWPETLDVACDETNALVLNPAGLAQLILDQRGEGEFFLTTGQVAKILVEYADGQIGDDAKKTQLYPSVRNELYRSIASSITVQSDTYAVFVMIGLGNEDEDGNPDPDTWRTTRRYFGVIDRSNCLTPEDAPATLMFSEVLANPVD